MTECKHGMNQDNCATCASPPTGINKTVYWTAGGQTFHNDRNCSLLSIGQDFARQRGQKNHPIQSGPFSKVANRGACSSCCQITYRF